MKRVRGKCKQGNLDDGWAKWGGYNNYKNQKLSELEYGEVQSNIFNGVSIYVNGYTEPNAIELRKLITQNGGIYCHRYSKKAVTHIIASNLAISKVLKLTAGEKVVEASWILESIKMGKLLPINEFQLYKKPNTNQPLLTDMLPNGQSRSNIIKNPSRIKNSVVNWENGDSNSTLSVEFFCPTNPLCDDHLDDNRNSKTKDAFLTISDKSQGSIKFFKDDDLFSSNYNNSKYICNEINKFTEVIPDQVAYHKQAKCVYSKKTSKNREQNNAINGETQGSTNFAKQTHCLISDFQKYNINVCDNENVPLADYLFENEWNLGNPGDTNVGNDGDTIPSLSNKHGNLVAKYSCIKEISKTDLAINSSLSGDDMFDEANIDNDASNLENYRFVDSIGDIILPTQIDPDVLNQLPADLQDEIRQKMTLKTNQNLCQNPVDCNKNLGSKLLLDRKNICKSPTKNMKKLILYKTPSKNKKKIITNRTPNKNRKNVGKKNKYIVMAKTFKNSDFHIDSLSQIDDCVFNNLPEDIRCEIKNQLDIKKLTSHNKLNDNMNSLTKIKCNPHVLNRCSLAVVDLNGRIELEDVKEYIREWIKSTNEPLEEDTKALIEYFVKLLENSQLDYIYWISKYLLRLATKEEAWSERISKFVENVQSNVIIVYGKPLKL